MDYDGMFGTRYGQAAASGGRNRIGPIPSDRGLLMTKMESMRFYCHNMSSSIISDPWEGTSRCLSSIVIAESFIGISMKTTWHCKLDPLDSLLSSCVDIPIGRSMQRNILSASRYAHVEQGCHVVVTCAKRYYQRMQLSLFYTPRTAWRVFSGPLQTLKLCKFANNGHSKAFPCLDNTPHIHRHCDR